MPTQTPPTPLPSVDEMSLGFNPRAAHALRTIYQGLKTGALICEGDEAKRIVHFETGYLVGAKSDREEERLGEVMVREGRITREQLSEATRFIRSGRKLGQILVELGYLRGGEIERYVRLQILEIASRILLAAPKRLVFSDRVPVEAVTLSPVSIADVFVSCFKSLPVVSSWHEALPASSVLTQTDDALALAQSLKLVEEEAFLLDLVDGRLTVEEILGRAPFRPDDALRVLLALHESGMVARLAPRPSRRPPSPAESPREKTVDPFERELIRVFSDMQCQNHWQVLGLERGASLAEIERAYRERTARFDPGTHAHVADTDFQEKLSFVHARVEEAFSTLSSKSSASVYGQLDQRESQYQAEKEQFEAIASGGTPSEGETRSRDPEGAKRLFARAMRAYQEQDFWSTIELCRLAIELDETNDPERFYLLGKALSVNPRWRRDAEQNLSIAHKLEPWEPRYLVALGKLYEREGLHARAQRVMEQVRTMDPDYGLSEPGETTSEP